MKRISVESSLCTGCMICQLVCSTKRLGIANPLEARIKVIREPDKGLMTPRVCRQCDPAPCVEACQAHAISRNEDTGLISIDKDLCTDCHQCMEACPFEAMRYSPNQGVMVCDLCGGDPICVKYCKQRPKNSLGNHERLSALQFVEL